MTELNREQITDAYISKFINRAPQCRRILQTFCQDREYLSDVAHTKRFLERYVSDARFRELLKKDPSAAACRYGLEKDPEEIRLLWDEEYGKEFMQRKERILPLSVKRYRLFIREKIVHRERMRTEECVPVNRAFRRWRERQINRSWTQFGPGKARAMVHPPVIFELSRGCSIGCWFCGFSAGAKDGDFLYTSENAELWRGILRMLREMMGPAGAGGVCYWATDPLDNPDYEKFCIDYATILGRFPQTTTAQPEKHVERVRKLLPLARSMGGIIDRFSILTLDAFNRLHEAFSAEELLYVELITQNMESKTMLGSTGRARGSRGLRKKAQRLDIPDDEKFPAGSIACLSGFLVNMLDRTIKLVAPCPSEDRWPSGYWLLEEGTFSSVAEFEKLAEGMIERHMISALRPDDPVAFRSDLVHSTTEDGFTLASPSTKTTFRDGFYDSGLAGMIDSGDHTAGEIALEMDRQGRLDPTEAFQVMNRLLQEGFLNEDPAFFSIR